jgi:hypothetical protein
MSEVLSETDAEIEMLRKYQDVYGYAFYLLRAA